MMPKVLR